MPSKKTKKNQCFVEPKWVESNDGTFSLVIESKKPLATRGMGSAKKQTNKVILILN